MASVARPEASLAPELFYNETESAKYTSSSRIITIQNEIANRCIELLNLESDKPAFILDVGCGSGLSGQALEEAGHVWVGCDVSPDMLDIAAEAQPETGDVMRHDMGLGLPFRSATFDGCISVSALQWLCYSNLKEHSAKKRLMRFFSSLYSVLKRTAKAALQFYPENSEQAVLIASCASSVGFAGGLVVDFPNSSKAKKYYLVLGFDHAPAPRPLGAGEEAGARGTVKTSGRDQHRQKRGKNGKRKMVQDKQWILDKKERQRNKIGQERAVRRDTKFTGRKRKDKF